MSKLTDAQLAEIAARHEQERQWSCEKHAEVSPGEPYSESGWCPMDMSLADVSALLNHIAAVTAELAAANARADGERAAVVAYLRGQADMTVRQANENKISNAAISTAVRSFRLVADAIERGEHEKGGGDG